jgi:HSP20 family molecular chaperone IbpA
MASESKELINQPEHQVEERKESEIKYRIQPHHTWSVDYETNDWLLEIELPGVNKDNIHIRYLEDYYELRAVRDQVEYILADYFPFDIDLKSVTGKYNQGLLTVTGKIRDPLAEAIEVKLS